MWSDLFKRWLDMVTWWMPRGSRDSDDPGTGPSHDSSRSRAPSGSEADQKPNAGSPATGAAETSRADSTKSSSGQQAESPAAAEASAPAGNAAGSSDADDDLTSIKGIGPAIKERLHDNGIRSFRDLANADAAKLTSQLKEQTAISEKRVQGWIDEARKHAK